MPQSSKSRFDAVDGVLLLNKPAGMTSNQALQRARRCLRARKAGHTGSLDPAATGMLPVCFGEATKVCSFLLDADKTYRVTAQLGTATDTGDAEGKVSTTRDVHALSQSEWSGILEQFLGCSEQVPPMYSALRYKGRRLYELARQGESVERKPRSIRIEAIELLEIAGNRLVFRVRCSKGTYVRTLVEDIAHHAGTVAHTARLHRESVAGFQPDGMRDLAEIEAKDDPETLRRQLLPVDAALTAFPRVCLSEEQGWRFRHGQAVDVADTVTEGFVRVYAGEQQFLGVGTFSAVGQLVPRRVFGGGEKNP